MFSVDLPPTLEKQFLQVIQNSYQGNLQTAMSAFLVLHEKYGWKEQLLHDIDAVRSDVKKQGGVNQRAINEAIQKYRQSLGSNRV